MKEGYHLYKRCSNKTGHTGSLALTSEQMRTLDHVRMRMINSYFKPYKRQRRREEEEEEGGGGGKEGGRKREREGGKRKGEERGGGGGKKREGGRKAEGRVVSF